MGQYFPCTNFAHCEVDAMPTEASGRDPTAVKEANFCTLSLLLLFAHIVCTSMSCTEQECSLSQPGIWLGCDNKGNKGKA